MDESRGVVLNGGIRIKKVVGIIVVFSFVFMVVTIVRAEENNREISRHILTRINFNAENESVEAHYLLVQQDQGKELIINENFVKEIYLDDVSGFDMDNVMKRVFKDKSLYYDIFVNDEILGMKSYIYRVNLNRVLDASTVQSLVKDVVKQNEKDFKNPPEEKHLDEYIVTKMQEDGLEAQKAQSYKPFSRLVMPIIMLLAACGVILGVIRKRPFV